MLVYKAVKLERVALLIVLLLQVQTVGIAVRRNMGPA